jgi:hypothetical protein
MGGGSGTGWAERLDRRREARVLTLAEEGYAWRPLMLGAVYEEWD